MDQTLSNQSQVEQPKERPAKKQVETLPYWLSGGFRPFFFLGALAMAASVLLWLPVLFGLYEIPTSFAPRDWHVHTMLFGAIPAIIAGFALTAVSNWTGRPHVAGSELLMLVVLWLGGRVAVSTSAIIGAPAAALADLAFFAALVWVFAREVVSAKNYRNLRVVAVVALLGVANACFHLEAMAFGATDHALRGGIAVVLMLVMLVGGRIIPAFTRNWLMARQSPVLPAPFTRFDAAAMIVAGAALLAWSAVPDRAWTAALLIGAGILHAIRLSRWCGLETRAEPLLSILHLGYATIPLGFVAVGAAILAPGSIDPASATHVWAVGTFGVMTLAVMTRASRGHSGHKLEAGRLEIAIFALVLLGALARVAAPYAPDVTERFLEVAALAWALAYLGFAVGYGRMLLLRPASA
ncbi:NnrS family protein [Geminicoccus harenae]|uniref:NnrS family protein n=1 Tax=Geminicoccus harenae TaxID=2498453 RepID=UPI00168AD2C2|nr:NnrS family protein [Geminicoccus harenae]